MKCGNCNCGEIFSKCNVCGHGKALGVGKMNIEEAGLTIMRFGFLLNVFGVVIWLIGGGIISAWRALQ